VSGPPYPGAPYPADTPYAGSGAVPANWPAQDAGTTVRPGPSFVPPPQTAFDDDGRGRLGRRVALLALVALAAVLVIGAAALAVRALPRAPQATGPTGPTSAAATPAPEPSPMPPTPGIEPPIQSSWPKEWVSFAPEDPVHTLRLRGLRFPLTVPYYWNCSLVEVTSDEVEYTCGGPISYDEDISGKLYVRTCRTPCDAKRQTAMRATEEAWGAQWRFAGRNVTIAETLELDGDRYGLSLVGYFSSKAGGKIDRQLVLRVSSPQSWLGDIRKVANSVRDGADF
jgi:hypothetical protein